MQFNREKIDGSDWYQVSIDPTTCGNCGLPSWGDTVCEDCSGKVKKTRRGGSRAGAGRKKSSTSKIFHTVGLTAAEWEFLGKWFSGNKTGQLRELIERAQKFWPAGPSRFR